jgi:hypothetical protein
MVLKMGFRRQITFFRIFIQLTGKPKAVVPFGF